MDICPRLKSISAFPATLPGMWPKSGCSEPEGSLLGLWIKLLDKCICFPPLDWKPKRGRGRNFHYHLVDKWNTVMKTIQLKEE